MKTYDLAIIGSGPGGYVAALYASNHAMNVCVIEKTLIGGTCLNRGCIPTKVMVHAAHLIRALKEASAYGVNAEFRSLDSDILMKKRDDVVSKLRAGIETLFRARKIDLIKGSATFKDPTTISVDPYGEIAAKQTIIAAGSKPLPLPSIACDEKDVLSSDGILGLKNLPKSLIIIGGGVVGCEFASVYNALGVKVTIIELLDRIVPTLSREASKKLEMVLKKRGVGIHTATRVSSISHDPALGVVCEGDKRFDAEKVLVCVGRAADIDGLGLSNAGIRTERGRIVTDDFLRTNLPHVYAIGDCVDGPQLAHKASYDGILACDNILGKSRRKDYTCIPQCVYTDPEVASVGMIEEEAKAKDPQAKTAKFPYLGSGKAYLIGRSEGYIKITGNAAGDLLGVEILGEGACDLIGEAALAVKEKISVERLAGVVHGHPTLSEIFQEAAHIFCGTPIHGV